MKEFNNRNIANHFAEYITGKELRQYVADKVKKYVGDSPSVFDGAVGSGQLEEFVNPSFVVGVEIQKQACETFKENYPNSNAYNMSFFNYDENDIAECAIMNPPFSIKFKDLTPEEQENIQKEFGWKKSGVVDDIFLLKSLKHYERYGFYIMFPGICYRKSEKMLRDLIGDKLLEINWINNAFEDTPIMVVMLVIDKHKKSSEVYKSIYDCKTKQTLHSETVEDEEERWQQLSVPKEEEKIDPIDVETQVRQVIIDKLKHQLDLSKFMCEIDETLPPFENFVDDLKRIILNFDSTKKGGEL